ncbi:MAG: ATP-binding cassette domain-containing protein [Myxococcota bacterium]
MPGPTVSIDRLQFRYAAAGFSLAIDEAHFGPGVFGLLGPNGAGKTTLMKLLAGLLTPQKGSLRLGDDAIEPGALEVRRRIALMPQDFGLFAGLDVDGCLRYLSTLHGLSRSDATPRIDELTALLELGPLLRLRGDRLSGGQRQKVGLAMALMMRPQLLLVDEPTAGLDPIERERVLRVLYDYGRNATVLLSTHIVEDVSECCTHAAILIGGALARTGTTPELADALAGQLWTRPLPEEGARPLRVMLQAGVPVEWRVSAEAPGDEWSAAPPSLRATFGDLIASQDANPPS